MLEILERWLEHYLKGVDNGIENEPAVLVESCVDQSVWMHSDTWPPGRLPGGALPNQGYRQKAYR